VTQPHDSQTPDATLEQRQFWLKALRAAARYRHPTTKRQHFCHEPLYRGHYVRRIVMLRKAIQAAVYPPEENDMNTQHMTSEDLAFNLANFYGTENWTRHALNKQMLYTDGVAYFAEHAGNGAHWFLDIVATELAPKAEQPGHEFMAIRLMVHPGGTASITADDGDGLELYKRGIQWTDCPSGTWSFYLTDNVLMLPTEY